MSVIEFPNASQRRRQTQRGYTRRSTGANIRTLCFRSYDLIVEADRGWSGS